MTGRPWEFVDMRSPEEYADASEEWVRLGARAVGGCCGLGPAYVKALAERFSR